VTSSRRVAVLGAGSIGCFVGGMLARGGHDVGLVARPRVIEGIRVNGLRLTSVDGLDDVVPAARLRLSDQPDILGDAEVILVTVKSNDTAAAAELIARHGTRAAVVISLQNGVGNGGVLAAALSRQTVLAGMVAFNVQSLGEGRFHRATSGDIVVERDAADTARRLSVPGLVLRPSDNIAGVQWGKLILNLNNALNALSGLTVRAQLMQRPWRLLMADQWAEALKAVRAAGIQIVAATPVPAAVTPFLLRLPDPLFKAMLGRTMTIDATARSSMSDDLLRGRLTEIDFLQGVIVDLARKHGLEAPIARRVVALIKQAEAAGNGLPNLTPEQVRSADV
jgi:2-dehydropantoate 2-reductase